MSSSSSERQPISTFLDSLTFESSPDSDFFMQQDNLLRIYDDYTTPQGYRRYARALLEMALFEVTGHWGKLNTDFKPLVCLQTPPPPLFNAFMKGGGVTIYTADQPGVTSEEDMAIALGKRDGKLEHGTIDKRRGTIKVNEALALTLLHLRTTCLCVIEEARGWGSMVPKHMRESAAKELQELACSWDSWSREDALDPVAALPGIRRNVADFPPNGALSELAAVAEVRDVPLVAALAFLVAHEYAHAYLDASEGPQVVASRAPAEVALSKTFNSNLYPSFQEGPYRSILARAKPSGEIQEGWVDELSADFLAFEWCSSFLSRPGINRFYQEWVAICGYVAASLIGWICSSYLDARGIIKVEQNLSHPPTQIRSMAMAEYLTASRKLSDYRQALNNINIFLPRLNRDCLGHGWFAPNYYIP